MSFSKYSRQQLIDLCRTNKVKGFSHKSVDELIGLLVNAGIKPADDKTITSTNIAPETTIPNNVPPSPETTRPYQYIFYTSWDQVLPYIEERSAKLVIVDAPAGKECITESLRILETGGTLVIRGIHEVSQNSLHASWVTVGSEKVLVLRQEPYTGTHKTLGALYDSLIKTTDGTILLPFASEEVCKLLRNRSFIVMDGDEARVSKLYSLVH